MNNELIKTNYTNDGNITVSGRELHKLLEVKTPYTQWFERMTGYGFEENSDFRMVSQKCETNNPKNPTTTITDHEIKLDMAKEIAMLQRNEKGKMARQYFIQVEKAWNSPEMIMKRALEIANERVKALQLENNHQQEVIQGLTDNITIAEKRSILNKVVRKGGNYKERYSALYQAFKDTYHIDAKKRYENYNKAHSPKCTSVMDYVDKQLDKIPEMYNIACKLFESDVDKLVKELYALR